MCLSVLDLGFGRLIRKVLVVATLMVFGCLGVFTAMFCVTSFLGLLLLWVLGICFCFVCLVCLFGWFKGLDLRQLWCFDSGVNRLFCYFVGFYFVVLLLVDYLDLDCLIGLIYCLLFDF